MEPVIKQRPVLPEKCHHHHSAEEKRRAFAYLEQGKTIKETAALCDVSVSTIKAWKRNYRVRGENYLRAKKRPYSKYPDDLKRYAVSLYLQGTDAVEVALLLGILEPTNITVWARDARWRGGLSMEDEQRPAKNNERRRSIKPIEEMTPAEELEFLRMENAILKKAASLRKGRQRSKTRYGLWLP